MTDLRQGVTDHAHDALDRLERLRGAVDVDQADRGQRKALSYAALQVSHLRDCFPTGGSADVRRELALEAAAALILFAERQGI